MGVAFSIDPKNLSQTGWGVLFPEGGDPAIEQALAPLLNLRRAQARNRFWRFSHKKGESSHDFLWYRHGVSPGIVDTHRMPFYLMLVGDLEEIPFAFQSGVDIQLATGRLSFEDIADYARYAEGVVASEQDKQAKHSRAAFFVTQGDAATANFARTVAAPLLQTFEKSASLFNLEAYTNDSATKAHLTEILSEKSSPLRFLLISSHGVAVQPGQENQRLIQGAVVCQDWPGGSRIQKEHYFAASDIPESANISGMIGFLLGDFSGATVVPEESFYIIDEIESSAQTRQSPFLASLPRALLSHPRGGALAILARCGRGWIYSDASARKHLEWLRTALEDYISSLTQGFPIGYSHKALARAYSELMTPPLRPEDPGFRRGPANRQTPQEQLALSWAIGSDARNFMILGDPAARLL